MKKIKISELPVVSSLIGLFTIGVDSKNRSVAVSLECVQDAADAANRAAADVANVAADLAAQKAKEQGDIDRANAAISKEESARKAADTELNKRANDWNILTRQFILSVLNDEKAFITKESLYYQTGYYYYRVSKGIVFDPSLHNSVKIPASGYYLEKIIFRGTFVGILQAQNVFLERNDGKVFSYQIGTDGATINLSGRFSTTVESEKLKNIYVNYFAIDDNDYQFEFQFSSLDPVTVPVADILTIGEQQAVKGSSLYSEIGVPIENEGFLDASGVFKQTPYWRTSNYIPVIPGDVVKYRLSGQENITATIAFYDKGKVFISGLIPSTTGVVDGTIAVPDGCEYMRCCVQYEHKIYYTSYCFVNSLLSFKEQFNQLKDTIVTPVNLFDSIKKPIAFSGKTIHAFGDSITAGVSSPNLAPAGANSYINLFNAMAGSTLLNYAISGATFVPGYNDATSIYDKIVSISSACDIIMIAGGINDWQLKASIGQLGDDNTTTLYGVLKKICDYLKTTYPNAYIVFITPIPTTSTTTFGQQHPDNLNLYRKAIQEVAMLNGFSVVNGAGLGLPNEMSAFGNLMFDPSDRVHPTLAGHALYARSLSGKLL